MDKETRKIVDAALDVYEKRMTQAANRERKAGAQELAECFDSKAVRVRRVLEHFRAFGEFS